MLRNTAIISSSTTNDELSRLLYVNYLLALEGEGEEAQLSV
jgi:hypothetical protein